MNRGFIWVRWKTNRKKKVPTSVFVHARACVRERARGPISKGDTKPTENNNNRHKKNNKKNELSTSTIAFLSKVSERGTLESTITHGTHNGLPNCSFVPENTNSSPVFLSSLCWRDMRWRIMHSCHPRSERSSKLSVTSVLRSFY